MKNPRGMRQEPAPFMSVVGLNPIACVFDLSVSVSERLTVRLIYRSRTLLPWCSKIYQEEERELTMAAQ